MYSFELQKLVGGQWTKAVVHPIFGEDTSLSVARESGEKLCRYDMDGTFGFVNEDFDLLSKAKEDMRLDVYWEGYIIAIPVRSLVISAPFTREDLKYDWDNKIATLELKGKDQYTDFMEAMDAEYDLIQLAPPKNSVRLEKPAFVQVYVLGDTKVTNVFNNVENEVNTVNGAESKSAEEIRAMGFTILHYNTVVRVKTDPSWNLSYYDGTYFGDRNIGLLESADGSKKIVRTSQGQLWEIQREDGSHPEFYRLGIDIIEPGLYYDYGLHLTRYSSSKVQTGGEGKVYNRDIYGRIITDNQATSNGTINKSSDIWDRSLNYRYFYNFKDNSTLWTYISNAVKVTARTSNHPNKWKQDDNGEYFIPPELAWNRDRAIAIGWNQWIPAAIWFDGSKDMHDYLRPYGTNWELRDAYGIEDAIKALLGKIDKNMTEYSEFLENRMEGGEGNPILGAGDDMWLFLTPSSNVKKTQYEQAAQKGKISLKQILDMLRQCFGCYWYLDWIDDHWQLRIEHAKWFDNGGTYGAEEKPLIDLSVEKTNLSKKPWITDQHNTEYDLGDVKSRYEFEWGDKASSLFNGYPINVTAKYAKGKPVQKDKVANFTADIDLIQSDPRSVSDDVFALISARRGYVDGKRLYIVRSGEIGCYGAEYKQNPVFYTQNVSLTYLFLEQMFLNYEKPSCEMELEPKYDTDTGEKIEVSLPLPIAIPQRIVRQSLTMPFDIRKNDLCPEKVATDSVIPIIQGKGQIESIKENLCTGNAEIELLFKTNQNY